MERLIELQRTFDARLTDAERTATKILNEAGFDNWTTPSPVLALQYLARTTEEVTR